jgi:hypothetical protein
MKVLEESEHEESIDSNDMDHFSEPEVEEVK